MHFVLAGGIALLIGALLLAGATAHAVVIQGKGELRAAGNGLAVLQLSIRLRSLTQGAGSLYECSLFLEDLGDLAGGWLFFQFARLATWQRSYNVVITNIPGPAQPLYMLGARLEEIYPLVPLAWNQSLGVALFSYDGGLYWGLNADWDRVADLHDLLEGLAVEFEDLCKLADAGG